MLNTDFCYKISSPARRKPEWLRQNNKVTGSVTRQYCQEVRRYQAMPAKNKNLGMWCGNIELLFPNHTKAQYPILFQPDQFRNNQSLYSKLY